MTTDYPGTELNPWPARAKKGIIAGALAVVELANVWADGPEWLYPLAAACGAVLIYFVPNAPKWKDPRKSTAR